MTEIALPQQVHADSAATNGENGRHAELASPIHDAKANKSGREHLAPIQNFFDSDDNELSELSDIEEPTGTAPLQTNGHKRDLGELEEEGDDRPSKRRRLRNSTPEQGTRKSKIESPPWKKVAAEGPTTFTEGGRRKSGRINPVPNAIQDSGKRVTRQAPNGQPNGSGRDRQSVHGRSSITRSTSPSTQSSKRTQSSKAALTRAQPTRSSTRKASAQDHGSSTNTRKLSASPKHPTPSVNTSGSVGTRRSARHSLDDGAASATNLVRTPRIKIKVRPPLTEIPLVHRDQARARPKLGHTFQDYVACAGDIAVEQGGMLSLEDGPQYTDEMARHDAQIILHVEQEVEAGGLLAEGVCSVFEPQTEEEPPRQWAHMDHLVKAMSNFRRLMVQEQQRHRAAAKRLASACEAEWRRRNPQPKTAEELEQEAIEEGRTKLRQVIRALAGTWENVKSEISRRRLLEWEAEEQRRVKDALNQAVSMSERKLQARQMQVDAEDQSEETDADETGSDSEMEATDMDGDADSEKVAVGDESNMSSCDDEEDKSSVVSDEGLTQEELRQKYAHVPTLQGMDKQAQAASSASKTVMAAEATTNRNETSDESVDMDDDLGSTEEDGDEEDRGEEDGDGEGVEGSDNNGSGPDRDEPSGLLGLFFKKSELDEMKGVVGETEARSKRGWKGHAINDHAPGHESVEGGDKPAHKRASSKSWQKMSRVDGSGIGLGPGLEVAGTVVSSREDVVVRDCASDQTLSAAQGSADEPLLSSEVDKRDGQSAGRATVKLGEDGLMMDRPNNTVGTKDLERKVPSAGPARTSPVTDANTNAPSPSRSPSPRTTDTKPSDIETASSISLLHAHKADSRSLSPQLGGSRTEIPFLLRGTLREYQHDGLDWLAGLYANNTNGILADEMGLGKTIQAIALLAHLATHHEVWGPHLVIVPTSVMLNWEMEFKKWCPGFKILTYYGNQEERKKKRQGWTNDDVWNVCITSYQMVLQDQQVFRRRRWHYMLLDEAHNIKNFRSQRWQTLLGFNTHSRLLLTGTPLQNNLTELWSLLYFLAPPENGEGGFADLQEFHTWFARPEAQILESGREQLDDEARAIIGKLHKVLRPYLLRRLKADVEKQMPAKFEHVEFCRLSKRQRELYDGFLSRSDTRDTLASGNYMSIINCLMQLRKVCNHPDLFVDRPIMTSLRLRQSVAADYEIRERLIRNWLGDEPMAVVSLSFLNLLPSLYEGLSTLHTDRIGQLSTHRLLLELREAQRTRASSSVTSLDPTSVKSNLVYLESAARWGRFEELQHCVYLNALRRQQRPIYGKGLLDFLTLDAHRRPYKARPKLRHKMLTWFEEDSFLLRNAIPSLQQRAASMEMTIAKFACVTPAVVTENMNRFLLGSVGTDTLGHENLRLAAPIKHAPYMPKEPPLDPWHEARMRLTIQFPDKRLLQYDCGKLQALDKLLRRLQAGDHRALIFTQMTRVLDILEQFLNIHGHKYLRLDGATKVEQRQILTDRFNHDPRILCFILSTRSGGLGINLTGADTVIFYDQDWNPAMDKQCQDRCHRIGQTRDVHIYRLVSEHTIEANILRKASQKQMLDDVVIQEGEFTTDYFSRLAIRDVIGNNGEIMANENDVAATAAMDRVLGGVESSDQHDVGRVLEQAEDREDVAAARIAEKEIRQDEADFLEQRTTPGVGSGVSSARQGTPREDIDALPMGRTGQSSMAVIVRSESQSAVDMVEPGPVVLNAFGQEMHTIDDYMLETMTAAMEGTPVGPPKDRKKNRKKGKDTRKR